MERPSPRRHEIVGHTADIGLTATAPDLPSLFEEAALALAEVSADVDPHPPPPVPWDTPAVGIDTLERDGVLPRHHTSR